MEDKFLCPLTEKEISYNDCYIISMVAEGEAKETIIDESVRPVNMNECRKICLLCKNHPS